MIPQAIKEFPILSVLALAALVIMAAQDQSQVGSPVREAVYQATDCNGYYPLQAGYGQECE